MNTDRALRATPLLAALVATAALAACGSGASPTASSATPGASAAPASASAPPEELKKGLLGGVKLTEMKGDVDVGGKKVAFTIELPEGLKDFSEDARGKTYTKVKRDLADKSTFDGYSFDVMRGNPKWKELGLETVLAEMTKGGEFVQNKGKVLDKGTTDAGFWFTTSIEEKERKAILTMAHVTKGDVSLMCRGNYEGANIDKPEEIADTLAKVCKTLTITD